MVRPDRLRVAVEPGMELDLAAWSREHAAGLKPDSTPYGLDRMASYDVDVTTLGADHEPRAMTTRLATAVLDRARMDPAALLRSGLRQTDVLLTQHEKRGIPAILGSLFPGRPPVVTGLIWLTDETADVPAPLLGGLWKVLRQAGAIFVLSTAQVDEVIRRGIPRELVHYVPFGVDVTFWDGGDPARQQRGLVVSAGSDRDRDYPTLLAALTGGLAGSGARLEIAGPLGLPTIDAVTPLGVLPHAGLREAYRRASVVAVATRPNVHVSGITVVLEAMSCGRPVVVSDTTGMADYVEQGVTGLLVEPGDPTAMADSIAGLLADPARARAMGEAARKVALREFSTERYAERLSRVCKQVAGRV